MLKMNSKIKARTCRWMILIPVIIIIIPLVVMLINGLDNRMMLCQYAVESEKITNPVRIALVTDLHSCKYGENQSELLDAIAAQNPDLVFLVGDLFDDDLEDTNTELFLAGISGKYPCYYVTGNHECWSGTFRFDMQMSTLAEYNISVLSDETVVLDVNGETINLCGVNDPDIYAVRNDLEIDPQGYTEAQMNKNETFISQLAKVSETASADNFTILLSHRPEYYETYAEYGFDIVLCGHAHGGQWRIPGLLNGLYAPHQGIFPRYAGGRYDTEDMTMIVSRGLARETTWVPRIYNPPELVIIELE